jgi:hypothetical protein
MAGFNKNLLAKMVLAALGLDCAGAMLISTSSDGMLVSKSSDGMPKKNYREILAHHRNQAMNSTPHFQTPIEPTESSPQHNEEDDNLQPFSLKELKEEDDRLARRYMNESDDDQLTTEDIHQLHKMLPSQPFAPKEDDSMSSEDANLNLDLIEKTACPQKYIKDQDHFEKNDQVIVEDDSSEMFEQQPVKSGLLMSQKAAPVSQKNAPVSPNTASDLLIDTPKSQEIDTPKSQSGIVDERISYEQFDPDILERFAPFVQKADDPVAKQMGAPYTEYQVKDLKGFAPEDLRNKSSLQQTIKIGEETFRYKYWALLAEKLHKKISGAFCLRFRDPVYADSKMNNNQKNKRKQVISAYNALDSDKWKLFGGKKNGVDSDVYGKRMILLQKWYNAWEQFAESFDAKVELYTWKLFEDAVAQVRAVRREHESAAERKLMTN